VLKGLVKNLTDYGAFIDLGGIDGLLHITDMAWRRVKHPSEVVNIGDEVEVKVLKFDRERQRVSLGLKQLGDDPWVDISRRYPEHSRLFGKVSNIADYGCFVEIEEGVEGLVHVSEMDWTNKNVHPSKVVHVGEEVEVMVLDIDEERRRISLGMKQCRSNPWEEFAATHNKNDRVVGKIKSITDFGIFIGLDGGIDGLVHLSDLSWDVPGEEVVRNYKKGDELETVVLAVDAERERISLGVKQLAQDPFSTYLAQHPKGTRVTGKILAVDAKGATIELAEGVEASMRASEISIDQVDDARKFLKEGDDVEAMTSASIANVAWSTCPSRRRRAKRKPRCCRNTAPSATSGVPRWAISSRSSSTPSEPVATPCRGLRLIRIENKNDEVRTHRVAGQEAIPARLS
jgi:small subunit ribosomal protein S1